ncbi:non-specific lipid-transfer protein A-like [Lycium barbarum]|uniref:non-specific lipid-transfer protein A-like n=1 Tax=Lycium barbarum TaxID=112863 RepID=UPI00293E742D|nr:non-specific lipid-transfer protein A-like [Lycium barbarum]
MTKILLTLFGLALIVGQTNATIQCGTDVMPKVMSCGSYMVGPAPTPSKECCVGLQDLAKIAAASQPDRKAICTCITAAMKTVPVDFEKAKKLPDLCHFKPFMPLDRNPDCSKVI